MATTDSGTSNSGNLVNLKSFWRGKEEDFNFIF